jgi:preprotein translocase subunit SecE
MAVETKKMAKSIAAASSPDDSFGGKLKAWPERTKAFYNDVRTEMKKVTSPSFKEVQATTAVVIITVFLFGFYFWVVDNTIGTGINQLLKYLSHR